MPDQTIEIRHDQDAGQFVAVLDGQASEAVMKYREADAGTLDYYSTYTPESLRGRGIAGVIVRAALDYALDHKLSVIPSCPYVAKLIERDTKYSSLLA